MKRISTSPPEETADADLRQVVALIWRGRWTVLGLALLAAGAAALILARMPAQYDATAEILIDPRDARLIAYDKVVGDLPVDNAVIASEIAVLRSRRLVERAARAEGLADDPEFAAGGPSLPARIETLVRGWTQAPDSWPRLWPEPAADPPLRAAAAALSRRLTAVQKGRSYVIAVTVRTADPAKSARLANAVATAYIDDQLTSKFDATRRAARWLSDRVAALEAQAAASERAVEAYRAGQSLGALTGPEVAAQQRAEISTQLVSARAKRAEAAARHDQIRRLIDEKGERAAANVLSSPLILSLRQQRAEVKRREAELATRYGARHPKMINVRAELRDLDAAIAAELRKRVALLSNEVEVATAREGALTAALSEIEDRNDDLSRASVGLRALERQAEADRKIYEDMLARLKQTTEQEEIQQPDARLISTAAPPTRPAAPRKSLIGAFAGAGGGLIGLGLVFLGEVMANTFRTGAEAEALLGRPVLARLPRMRGRGRRARLVDSIRAQPNSALAEAARGLRTALALSDVDAPPRVVMVTSAAPGEGKSTTSLALALMSARVGKRAVVVECDMRRPGLALAVGAGLGRSARAGADLIGVLRGDADLAEALIPAGDDGAFILPVARPAPQAADILSSRRFGDLIAELAGRFDQVILDTPPVLAVSDAEAAARTADACLLLIRWDATPRQAAEESLARLTAAGVKTAGLALTMVDLRKEARYIYGGYRAGAPDYGAYYA